MDSIPVLEWDDDYNPPDGPHLAWHQARFYTRVDADTQYVQPGVRLYLREGRRILATAEEGARDRRTCLDVAEEAAETVVPWLPALRRLADAVESERTAQTLEFNLGQLLHHWDYVNDPDTRWNLSRNAYDEEMEAIGALGRAVRGLLPRQDQEAPLAESARARVQYLRGQAVGARTAAARAMPDPLTGAWPSVDWVGPYSRQQAEDIPADLWDADLPRQILRGWAALMADPDETTWRGEHETARRDALMKWALRRGLPKVEVTRASGIARTTIDRALAQ